MKSPAADPNLSQLLATLRAVSAPNVSQEVQLRRRLRAASSLRSLAEQEHWRPEMMMVGAIRPIVSLLSDSEVELAAARILRPLAETEACRASILAANALPRLIAMTNYGTAEIREEAAAVLGALAYPEQYKIRVLAAGAVPALVEALAAAVPHLPNEAKGQGPMDTFASAGTAESSMTSWQTRLATEAAATLCKLAAGSEDTKLAIVLERAIPYLVEMLSCPCRRTCLEAMRLLGELCDLTEGRAAIAESGALRVPADVSEQIRATSMPVPNRGGIVVPVGEPGGPLVDLLNSADLDVQAEAAAVIAALGTRREDPLEPGESPAFDGALLILSAGTLTKLVDMLSNANRRGKTQAARAMFGIAVPEVEENRTAIVAAGSLLPLVAIVRAGDGSCAEGRAWAASTLRLLASSPARRRAIEDAVPIVAPHGRRELMAPIHAYCF
mmetsp:Transcript_45449/g.83155  ORF Transcript_45449/g.83155 Transcript_45449/m.83155 type:complete len:443 (+) Transcript_45449:124-1452(+)